MNKDWTYVFVAAIFEVIWVSGLKHADNLWAWAITLLAIIISFFGLINSGKSLPVGTVYAVFVGLGTAGTVISEIVFFHEPIVINKLLLIVVLLFGVIGLKMVTVEKDSEGAKI